MARPSDPNKGQTQDRFLVWDNPDDLYSRAQLEENWDTLDAILGRPPDGVSQWPEERGVGAGIWGLIESARAEQPKLGDVKHVWVPSQAALSTVIADQAAAGWEPADGRVITSGNHDFGDLDSNLASQSIPLPTMVDKYITGVAPTSTVGADDGVTVSDGTQNVGTEGGPEEATIEIDIPAHTHTMPAHSHSLPAHQHGMHHRHYMYSSTITLNGGKDPRGRAHALSTNSRFGTVIKLRKSAVEDMVSYDDFGDSPTGSNGPGWEYAVPHAKHKHLAQRTVTGFPIQGSGQAPLKQKTDLGGSGATGQTAGVTGSNGAHTSTHTLDNRPPSVGLIPFIKVRKASTA